MYLSTGFPTARTSHGSPMSWVKAGNAVHVKTRISTMLLETLMAYLLPVWLLQQPDGQEKGRDWNQPYQTTSQPAKCSAFGRRASWSVPHPTLKVELVDIRLIENHRIPQNHLIAANLDRTQPSRLEAARSLRYSILRQHRRRVHRQVAQILRVPQDHRLHVPVVYIAFAQIRKRQPNHVHVLAPRLLHRLPRPGHRRRRDIHAQPHRGVALPPRL